MRTWVWLLAIGCRSSAPEEVSPTVDSGSTEDVAPPDTGRTSDGLYDLKGLGRDLSREDLVPIAHIIRDKSVVALGESIHTSGGFMQAKTRVLEMLVEDYGYRVIAFESPWAGGEAVDAYVQGCLGTADDVTKNLHTIWWDVSVSELLGWMCNFNKTHTADPVRFMGFDIRQPWIDAPALRAYLDKVAPADAARISDGLSKCFGVGYLDERAFFSDPQVMKVFNGESMVPEATHTACVGGVAAAKAFLAEKRTAMIAASSALDFELARLHVVSIGAFEDNAFEFFGRDQKKGYAARDAGMFDVLNTLRAFRFPGKSVAISEHNQHLTRKNPQIEGGYWPVKTLGTLLDEQLGPKYVPIGLIGRRVGTNWFGGPKVVQFNETSSLERALFSAGRTLTFVDLTTSVEAPFVAPDKTYVVGGERMKPALHYAGLIFVDSPEGAKYIGGVSPFEGL